MVPVLPAARASWRSEAGGGAAARARRAGGDTADNEPFDDTVAGGARAAGRAADDGRGHGTSPGLRGTRRGGVPKAPGRGRAGVPRSARHRGARRQWAGAAGGDTRRRGGSAAEGPEGWGPNAYVSAAPRDARKDESAYFGGAGGPEPERNVLEL